MQIKHTRGFHALGMASALALLLVSTTHAQILAGFTDGNGSVLVDQYVGIAGSGWSTAWATNTNSASTGTTLVGNVINTDPLNGGGNYLSTTLTAGTGTGNGKGVVQRQYTSFGNVSLSQIHTVSFDFRFDSSMTGFDAATDYIQAFDRPFNSDFGADGAWLIRATGASTNGIAAHNWMFYNGGKNGAPFNNANFVDSGVSLVSGQVYHFDININPALLEYSVSINGGAFSAPMGFRANTAANLGRVNWGGQLSGISETMTYSLDTIAVTAAAVPEPSTVMLLGASALAVITLRRRRRN